MARIVIDSFFHMMPGHRLSRNIAVGGYVTNYGRYSPNDIYHPNGASMIISDLVADNDVIFSTQPFSDVSLCGADILIIPNPDYPMYEGTSPYRIDAHDVDALFSFMERGGSVLLLVNSFYQHSDFWEENFDYERVNPIFERMGLKWDDDFMSDDQNILPAKSGAFTVGYGQGGRIKNAALPADAQPLLTYQGDIFGFIKPVGLGKMAVIGDAGLISNGLYAFPGFENKAFLTDLMNKITPAFCGKQRAAFEKVTYGNLSCATSENGITDDMLKSLRPGATYKVDHHYRHMLWDKRHGTVPASAAASELPFDFKALAGRRDITIPLKMLGVCEGADTSTINFKLNVVETKRNAGTDYFVTGNALLDDLKWKDIGAVGAFTDIGKLARVGVIVQAELSLSPDGGLNFATFRQGYIMYANNPRNAHYGIDILLGSAATVYSPRA